MLHTQAHPLYSLLQTKSVFMCYDLFTLAISQTCYSSQQKATVLRCLKRWSSPGASVKINVTVNATAKIYKMRKSNPTDGFIYKKRKRKKGTIVKCSTHCWHLCVFLVGGPLSQPVPSSVTLLWTGRSSIEHLLWHLPQMESIAFHVYGIISCSVENLSGPKC